MVAYKLTYFDVRGLAEMSRLILTYAKQPFEDVRVEHANSTAYFEKNRKDLPFGQLPLLEVDGVKISQSCAIARYLARKHGLAGKDDLEAALVDSVADAQKDLSNTLMPYFGVVSGRVEGDKDKLKKDVVEPALEKFLPLFERLIKASGSGFFAKSGVTWVDFFIGEGLLTMTNLIPEVATKYPWTAEYIKRVHSIPQIKDYVAKRPVTPF